MQILVTSGFFFTESPYQLGPPKGCTEPFNRSPQVMITLVAHQAVKHCT